MRKLLRIIVIGMTAVVGAECISSYILYRHYATLQRPYQPVASATYELLQRALARTEGRQDFVKLSIDHGPLFRPDPVLGYAMNPGEYYVTEELDNQRHRFRLGVDELGHRRTSYTPVDAPRRIFITGDSGLFGWGLDDEETLPWLLQTRLPGFRVVNLSLTSYSTIQALLQLQRVVPPVSADDIVLLTYHRVTNEFNVADAKVLEGIIRGFETQLGDTQHAHEMTMPFGFIDANGVYSVKRVDVDCGRIEMKGRCNHPEVSDSAAERVTERAFDEIISSLRCHIVVAVIGGPDSDPVVAYLRKKGIDVADLRTQVGDPDPDDIVTLDGHSGPFWHHVSFERLVAALNKLQLI
jgi:hypothetical protein